jgi:hypothetical protein
VEASERFRDQAPAPGSKEAILHGIAALQHGTPNYERMGEALAAAIRRQADHLHEVFVSLGAVESIFFRGVGPGGYDIYGVKFANGSAEFRLLLGPDGKVNDILFRPDGDGQPGGVADCASEATLKARADGAPIRIFFYNDTGSEIQVYPLDAAGKRGAATRIGDSISGGLTTSVNNPVVVTGRSGECLEIVPGRCARARPACDPARRQRGEASPIYRWREPRPAGLRPHDRRSRNPDAPAAALQPGDPGQARRTACDIVPRRHADGQ